MVLTPQQISDERTSRIASTIVAVLILILLLIPFFGFQNPPPVNSGVLVSFGEPDQGTNDTRAAPSQPVETEEEVVEETQPEEVVEETKPKPKPEPKKPKAQPVKQVNNDERSKERAIRAAKLKEEREQQKAEDEAKAAIQREELAKAREAKRRREAREAAEAEAQRKREAEAQALRDALTGGLSGNGNGTGNNGKPGDQGDPDGNPDGTALDGISTGAGEIGGGLGSRGVLYKPQITHNSQRTGDVVVRVCVNSSGKVVSADFTQNGSTTADAGLISKAEEAAKKYKFDKGAVERQCGTIKIKFRVR